MKGSAAAIRTSRRLKLVLGAMILVGLLTLFTVGGVYGLLSSQLQNQGSSISSGTMTMNDTQASSSASTTLTQNVGTTTLASAIPQTSLTSSIGSTTLTQNVGATTLTQNVGVTTLSVKMATTTTDNDGAGITVGATQITPTSTTNWPTTYPFYIQIDSEIMKVTALGAGKWTVTRAQDGTTATTHSKGATITQVSLTPASTASFPSSGFDVLVGTEQMAVTATISGVWIVTRAVGGTTIALHSTTGVAVNQDTLTVNSATNFPASGFTILVNSEQMTVTAESGAGNTTWNVTRAVNSTTAASHTSGATANQITFTVASAAGFPSSGNYGIQIDNEQMTVTGGQGTTTWTVTRAVNGTTAAGHSSGTAVYQATIGVSSASGFPGSGNYTIQIDNEQMTVTAGQGTTTWTVTRGVNGTSAATHTAGTGVEAGTISVNSAASFPGSGNYTIQVDNEQMTVTGGQGTTTWTVTRGANGTFETSHSNGATVNQASLTVASATGFPTGSDYTVLIGSEELQVVSGMGSTTWTVTRGADGTSVASHSSGASVATSPCRSIDGTSNVNNSCDSIFTFSPGAENSPGNPVTGRVTITDSGSIGVTDMLLWMPSCLRGITPDAPFASSVPAAPTFSGASNTGGHLNGLNTYYYEITAVSSSGESVAGSEASYTTPVGTNTNQITLNWSAVSGATSYKVYRATVEGEEQLLASGIASTSYTDSSATFPSGSGPPTGTGSGDPCGQTTKLASGINASQTSLTVATDAGFPTTGNFEILVDGEEMTVTGGQGTTTWTVTRAANGTAAASHNAAAQIKLLNDDAQLTIQEVDSSGTDLACWYPTNGTSCTGFDGTYDLGLFAQYIHTLGTALDLGTGPTAQHSRYFKISVQLPSAADNSLQGTTAQFTLMWYTAA